jgi:hypothetical protein
MAGAGRVPVESYYSLQHFRFCSLQMERPSGFFFEEKATLHTITMARSEAKML